jgi:hypothetical protein
MTDKYVLMRMDNRTEEDFREDLEQFTKKEFYWGIALRYHLCETGSPCMIEEHGVDNTGRLIPGRLPNHNADKKYHFHDGREMTVEVKTIPEWCDRYMTFKVSALKGCWNQGAYILVPKKKCLHFFGKASFLHLLQNLPARTDIRSFGNKPVVRAETYMINQMIERGMVMKKDWSPKAKEYIDSMSHILLEERRTAPATR